MLRCLSSDFNQSMCAALTSTTGGSSGGNKVVFAGGPKSGKRYLLSKICERSFSSLSYTPHPTLANIASCQWTINNKYYSADLDFWVTPTQHVSEQYKGASSGLSSLPSDRLM